MHPWIKEMERRKLIRDEIRQKRGRTIAREESGYMRAESVSSESNSDTMRTRASDPADSGRHKGPASLKGVTYTYPEPRGSAKRSRSRDRWCTCVVMCHYFIEENVLGGANREVMTVLRGDEQNHPEWRVCMRGETSETSEVVLTLSLTQN